MIKIYLLTILMLLPVVSAAQGKIKYTYDAAGNRVRREAAAAAGKSKTRQLASVSDGQVASGVLRDHFVKVYPNPTDGVLRIGIYSMKPTDKCSLRVYAPHGALLLSQSVTTADTDIDISDNPAGIYLLKVDIDGHSQTFKITKI